MRPVKPLSRDAEIIALSLFGFGPKSSVRFAVKRKLSKRAKAAFKELENHGLIRSIPKEELPKALIGWQGTEDMGLPMRRFKAPVEKQDSFPLFITKKKLGDQKPGIKGLLG